MENLTFLWAILGFLVVLTPIVLIHELGHFWAAKLSNIKIDEFGFGIPPRMLTIAERNGTKYTLNWIPVGGFVRPAGEDDPSVPGGLASASKRARIFVLAAGSAANFIFALFLFWLALVLGPPAIAITDVAPNSPALSAGLLSGDVILAANGVEVDSSGVLVGEIYENLGREISVLVNRNGEELLIPVFLRNEGDFDPEVEGPMGIGLGTAENGMRLSQNPLEAVSGSFAFMWEYISIYGRLPGMLMSGEITAQEARPVSIVGISQIAGQAAESSATTRNPYSLLSIAAFISVALGLTNLLPIPALDGGRILFVLVEAVRGRRIEPEREGMVHVIGMLVLLGLMALMIVQDIINPIVPLQ